MLIKCALQFRRTCTQKHLRELLTLPFNTFKYLKNCNKYFNKVFATCVLHYFTASDIICYLVVAKNNLKPHV